MPEDYRKKTVVLHPLIEQFVRQTQGILINADVEGTYSAAVNFMLLGFVMAASESDLPPEAMETVWSFARDARTIEEINLRERMHQLQSVFQPREHGTEEPPV